MKRENFMLIYLIPIDRIYKIMENLFDFDILLFVRK